MVIDVTQIYKSISMIFNENSVINYCDWFMNFPQRTEQQRRQRQKNSTHSTARTDDKMILMTLVMVFCYQLFLFIVRERSMESSEGRGRT